MDLGNLLSYCMYCIFVCIGDKLFVSSVSGLAQLVMERVGEEYRNRSHTQHIARTSRRRKQFSRSYTAICHQCNSGNHIQWTSCDNMDKKIPDNQIRYYQMSDVISAVRLLCKFEREAFPLMWLYIAIVYLGSIWNLISQTDNGRMGNGKYKENVGIL